MALAQMTWKELVGVRVGEAMDRSARARGLIADVLLDLRSPELVADASLKDRAQRVEDMLAQASCLLGEAASIMAAAWHIGTHAAAAIQAAAAPPRPVAADEVQRLRSALGQLQDARARAEKACRYAEDSRNELCAVGVLLRHRQVHLLGGPLDVRRASAIRSLEGAGKFELESVSLASKAADCLS